MDIKSPEERSKNMAAVKSRDTKPELRLRHRMWHAGCRYFTSEGWQKLTGHKLTGSPDMVFPAPRVVVFVDGCFWHGCPDHYQAPAERAEFWSKKLTENRERDERVTRELEQQGWKVLRIWEHDLRVRGLDTTVDRILRSIRPNEF